MSVKSKWRWRCCFFFVLHLIKINNKRKALYTQLNDEEKKITQKLLHKEEINRRITRICLHFVLWHRNGHKANTHRKKNCVQTVKWASSKSHYRKYKRKREKNWTENEHNMHTSTLTSHRHIHELAHRSYDVCNVRVFMTSEVVVVSLSNSPSRLQLVKPTKEELERKKASITV